jgi:hypothetical protein
MFRKLLNAIEGVFIMPFCMKIFDPQKVFRNKRIAIIGAANSAFQKEQGSYIDSFDIVVRINKALSTWNVSNEIFIGRKTDILFHSFFENNRSGGGPLDFDLFDKRSVLYVVNPINTFEGWRLNFNFYKKYKKARLTYILQKRAYHEMQKPFGRLRPTIGYAALYNVLNSPFKEVYITGFTFFKTPYGKGYRDDLVDMEANKKHIASQNIHDPEIEFKEFLKIIERQKDKAILFDETLQSIVANNRS